MKRKLLELWRVLTFRYMKVDNLVKESPVKVLYINDNSELLHDAFAITEERKVELNTWCEEALKEYQDTAKVMEIVSTKVAHANELAYCCYSIGASVERHRMTGGGGGILAAILGGMGKPPGGDPS
jgi:hypothetical protein